MIRTLKLLIVPSIIVALFALAYYIILPYANRRAARTDFFNSLENGLTNLQITYTKNKLDADEFGALMGYEYVADDKKMSVYIFAKDSKEYKEGSSNGYIVSKKNSETNLYGAFANDCVMFMESDFPYDTSVLNLFMSLSQAYSSIINN